MLSRMRKVHLTNRVLKAVADPVGATALSALAIPDVQSHKRLPITKQPRPGERAFKSRAAKRT